MQTRPTTFRNEHLTTDEAAAFLGKSVSTLSSWRRQRIGPHFFRQIGRIYYSKTAIEEWIANCKGSN